LASSPRLIKDLHHRASLTIFITEPLHQAQGETNKPSATGITATTATATGITNNTAYQSYLLF
jgi:hypothetical protein